MRTPLEKSGFLDRGGKPTVRDLLSSLVFNPIDGTIRLNGERIVMQRGAVGGELRRELIDLLGPPDARIFLMRLGFLSGRADARFVRTSWPKLELLDAFTAGTRLHMFSGVVRVETAFNEFDFHKKRFSAEFLWHDSLEAEEFLSKHRHATEPVCWTQLGYASGYASEFFDTLVVYKEIQCRAEGHDHCRVVGKPADMWGPGDPDVILFRERIATSLEERQIAPRRNPLSRTANSSLSDLDRILLAPVTDLLARYAPMAMPVLFAGATGTGRSRAAHHLHRMADPSGAPLRHIAANQVDAELCAQITQPLRRGKRSQTASALLIDDLRQVPTEMQSRLARAIEDGLVIGGPRVLALLDSEADAEKTPPLNPALRYAVSALTVNMSSLKDRPGDRIPIARALLPTLAARMGRAAPELDSGAARTIEQAEWPGNLRQMRAVLSGALAEHRQGQISAPEIKAQLNHTAATRTASAATGELRSWIAEMLKQGTLSVSAIEEEIYHAAVDHTGGNLSAAARLVGISRPQLAYRLKAHSSG